MIIRPTVLLEHVRARDRHFDWMILDPTRPPTAGVMLWTARVTLPTRSWARAGRFMLTPLAPHRRAYLTRQGRLTGGRGRVRRVDRGHAVILLWGRDAADLLVQTPRFSGRVRLRRLGGTRWLAATARHTQGEDTYPPSLRTRSAPNSF